MKINHWGEPDILLLLYGDPGAYSYFVIAVISGRTEGRLQRRHWFRYLGLVEELLKVG